MNSKAPPDTPDGSIEPSLDKTPNLQEGILFEGILLPPMLRPKKAEEITGIGHAVLYGHLNSGRIRSVALRASPSQKQATRLIYTRSLIAFIRACEAKTSGIARTPAKGGSHVP